MSLQYDQPTTIQSITDSFQTSTFTESTKSALGNLLGGGLGGGSGDGLVNAGVGSLGENNQLNVQAPSGVSLDFVVVNIPGLPEGSPVGPVTLDITANLQQAKGWIFDTNVGLDVTFNTVPRVIVTGRGSDNITVNGDANTTIESAGGNDTLTTSGGDDLITIQAGGNSSVSTGAGNDTIRAGTGNDTIDAGTGIDVVQYANSSAGYMITNFSLNQFQVESADGTGTLIDVERLHFSDKKLAMDLSLGQNAAMSLQIINVIGAELRNDPQIVGMILEMFDSGYTLASLAQHAIDVGWVTQFAGSTSNEDLARMAYTNTFGFAPNESQLDWALSYMDGRAASYTQAEFIVEAAQINENNDTINLIGVQQTGIEYLG